MAHICCIILNPDDVALATEPGYPVYVNGPIMCRRQPHDACRSGRTALPAGSRGHRPGDRRPGEIIFVGYPHNPTGAVIEDDFFARLVEFAHRHKLLIVHDNAYVDITYDGYVAPSIFETPGAKEVAVEFYSISKGYNMTGWRSAAVRRQRRGDRRFLAAEDERRLRHVRGCPAGKRHRPAKTRRHVREMCGSTSGGVIAWSQLCVAGLVVTPPKGTIYLWLAVPAGHSAASFTRSFWTRPTLSYPRARPMAPAAKATSASPSQSPMRRLKRRWLASKRSSISAPCPSR